VHTAEVAVNSATTGEVQSPVADEIGSRSTTVPIPMSARNPAMRTIAGDGGGRTRRCGATE
jgi:hypothetical protein